MAQKTVKVRVVSKEPGKPEMPKVSVLNLPAPSPNTPRKSIHEQVADLNAAHRKKANDAG